MGRHSAREVRDLIIDRIAAGVYPVGTRLPTAPALADELGVHRNTVAKAYRLLADLGLVTPRRGRGTYVCAPADRDEDSGIMTRIREGLEGIVLTSRRLGVAEDQLRTLFDEQIRALYRTLSPRGVFIECNWPDTRAHIAEIELVSRIRLEPLLLDDALRDLEDVARTFDIVFTSLFHVKEITDAIVSVRPDLRVIGLYAQPDEQALGEIARIEVNSRVGLVVSNTDGGHRFANLINTYNQVTVKMVSRPTDEQLRALAAEVDVLVCTRSQEAQIRAMNFDVPVIAMPFHISRQSAMKVAENLVGIPDIVSPTGR